jgi:Skp family chaperone for outer membrane proteins
VKRTIVLVAGLAALTAAYFGSHLLAQTPGQSAPAVTKVGVVNIGSVFMKYEKAKIFKAETEQILKPFRDEGEKLKKYILDWQSALQNPKSQLTEEQRKQGERTIIDCKRRLEDLDREARTKVGKRNEEQIVQLYKEINEAVKGTAAAQGFHLIFGYGEPMDGDLLSFMNISRKMQAMDMGSIIPMHITGGLDISDSVVSNLNRGYQPASANKTN